MTANHGNEKLQLKFSEWNELVSDETQCMRLSQDDEIKFLSSRNENLAEYLKHHPEMAHELMVPSGFKQCLVRRYERYLGGNVPVSSQNGDNDKARWNAEVFDAILPGQPKVIDNPRHEAQPTWREVNAFVCSNGVDLVSGERIAPHYEYVNTGKRARVIHYGKMQVEVSVKQWNLMWEHKVCAFMEPTSPTDVEFISLHGAFREILSIGEPWVDLKFPIGQQIAIILVQIEHRLRSAHTNRPNPCSECCPFREGPWKKATKAKRTFQQFLTKAEAVEIVCDGILLQKPSPLPFVNYDPVVRKVLESRGTKCAPDGANCHC